MHEKAAALLQKVQLPPMFRVRQVFDRTHIAPEDIPDYIAGMLSDAPHTRKIRPGMRIAITVGSRGVANIPIITKAIADFVKSRGAHPFVVPAQYEDKLPDGYTKIHKGVAYDDNAFRLFFERFGSEEWFRRTLFVFVADHVSSEKFAAQTRSYPGNYHIIGFMYTPDGALRGEVSEVVQQLDIMPTLLGLLGNREPYFAFGRDVLNEPQRPQWSVSWDGAFQAVTNDGTIRFDDAQETPAASSAGDSLLQDFRALVQQYYSHAEKKSYIVHD